MSQSDFVSRGQALVAAGQFQEAVKVCRLGLLGRPTTVDGRIVLGQALLALKRFDEVLAEMRVALELDPSALGAQVLKGEALLRKGDVGAAVETLHAARQVSPGDPRILQLLGQAEQAGSRGHPSTSHPAVSFVGNGDTRHYPSHSTGDEESGGGFTRPTSLSVPSALRKSAQRGVASEPSAAELAVGDRSGTVEVDPELEGVELEPDADFGEVAAPPAATAPPRSGGARGGVRAARAAREAKEPTPTIDLDDEDDALDLGETLLPDPPRGAAAKRRPPGPGSAIRKAVGLPSGPLDEQRDPARAPMPSTPAPLPPAPRGAGSLPPGISPASAAAAVRPTMAMAAPLPPVQPQAAAPVWAQATIAAQAHPPSPASLAAASEPTAQPAHLDPHIVALLGTPETGTPAALGEHAVGPRTGMRRERSRLQIVLWIGIAAVVIGGGVFAGFQIRDLRLRKQIAATRDQATELAKADTWTAWTAAAKSYAKIVGVSGTAANRAALARARALVAFEFGDGVADAKGAVGDLAGQGGLDGDLAAAYVALATDDAKAAHAAADAALSEAADDPAALYVAGRAALEAGDLKGAITYLREAFKRDDRPLYGVGLAAALARATSWDEALATLDKVLEAHPDHPAAVIERGIVLAEGGRVPPPPAAGMELHTALDKVTVEGAKAATDQPRGVSPAQVAFANLALARIDFARGDIGTARGDLRAAASAGLDDQRFAEEAVDTLYAIGDLEPARAAAEQALATWPHSLRARLALARVLLASGKPADAQAALAKLGSITGIPEALAVRGEARIAAGNLDAARGDFEAALAKLPGFEPAIVGLASLELDGGDVDAARKLVEPHVPASGATPAMATVYAAVLRQSGDPAARDKAKALLEKVVAGPPGPEIGRAQLELARVLRDQGDVMPAKAAFEDAVKTGSYEARLEAGLFLIDEAEPTAGRAMLDALLADQGAHASAALVLEVARARALVGDHGGAEQLLAAAEKLPDVSRWKLARERGRIALRKGDFARAATELGHALDGCDDDAETFLLAADTATSDAKATAGLTERLVQLAPVRLKGQPEADIVRGKLLIAEQKLPDAIAAFSAALTALQKGNASHRRQAQAHFGLAVAKYYQKDDAEAENELQLVTSEDPSLYAAYLFRAILIGDKLKKEALDLAKHAVELDPDSVDGWLLAGQLAHKLGDRATLANAVTRLGALAPNSDAYKQLAALRR